MMMMQDCRGGAHGHKPTRIALYSVYCREIICMLDYLQRYKFYLGMYRHRLSIRVAS